MHLIIRSNDCIHCDPNFEFGVNVSETEVNTLQTEKQVKPEECSMQQQQQQRRQERHIQTGNKDEQSLLDQLTECLCPIPIITYPQDVLLAIHREPE